MNWEFIVLDTDGVNAFAAPGGIIHVTRGALGLAKTEAELAGVLGHEITHVTEKHTIGSIQKSKQLSFVTDQVPKSGLTQDLITKIVKSLTTTSATTSTIATTRTKRIASVSSSPTKRDTRLTG